MGLATVELQHQVVPSETTITKDTVEYDATNKGERLQPSAHHLKAKLRTLLEKHHGSTKHPEVLEVVERLGALNTVKDAANSDLLPGDYVALTCPTFPGRIKPEEGQEDVVQYTLGRLSFNIFQPTKLVCTTSLFRNALHEIKPLDPKDTRRHFSNLLLVDMDIHTAKGDLPATLQNEAYAYENPDIKNRVMVVFTGGTLMPASEVLKDPSKLKAWNETFEGAYKKAEEEQSYFGMFFKYFLKLLLGLTYPSDEELAEKHGFHFDMKRSPVGYYDVVYLDDDMRITKGNRGTIVVAERMNPTE